MIASLVRPLARSQPLALITVSLIPKSWNELLRLQDRTRLSKTDVVNRAITLYEFVDAQTRAGQEILIRDKETGETRLVRFIGPGGPAGVSHLAPLRRGQVPATTSY